MVVGDAWVEFADDISIDRLPGDLFKNNESILDRDDATDRRQVVAVQWITPPLPFSRPRFRLCFLLFALSLIRAASPFLRFVPACGLLDFWPVIPEFLK